MNEGIEALSRFHQLTDELRNRQLPEFGQGRAFPPVYHTRKKMTVKMAEAVMMQTMLVTTADVVGCPTAAALRARCRREVLLHAGKRWELVLQSPAAREFHPQRVHRRTAAAQLTATALLLRYAMHRSSFRLAIERP